VKISCPACAAKYSIADEKVQDRLAKIRCRKCGTTIVIDGKVSPPHVYAAEGSAADHGPSPAASDGGGASEYSVDFGDNDQRTMSLADVVGAYNAGQLTAESFVWSEGMTDWKPLGEVPEIVDALHQAASRPSAPAPQPSPQWEAPRHSDAAIARAAVARPGRGGAASDLFGGFEHAGSEDDVMTSASEAQQQANAAAATGARNESSVLFSLSALTAAAKPSAPSPSRSSSPLISAPPRTNNARKDEDSGLIDLKALTAAAAPAADAPMPVLGAPPLGVSPLGVSPLGLAPLGGGVEAHALPAYPQKNRTGLFIGAGIALAAVVVAIAIIMRPAPPPPAPAQAPVAATPPPAPSPTPTSASDEVTAKPPATGTAGEAEEKGAAKPLAGGKARPRGGGGGGAKKPAAEAPPAAKGGGDAPKKPAAKSGGCGCAPGDLMCNMRCAAK
jgi:predicted Zn finger-like uncharacterized protein